MAEVMNETAGKQVFLIYNNFLNKMNSGNLSLIVQKHVCSLPWKFWTISFVHGIGCGGREGGRMQRGGGKHALNFEVFELRKRNIPTDKSQRVYKKNGAIYIFIMFTPGVMVIKMSKMAFLVFSTGWQQKIG